MFEIGSEFWLEDLKNTLNKNTFEIGKDNKFVFSGRTAIDFVIQDIQTYKKINTVYFPSYCCDSMLEPFIKNKIKIEFYDVLYTNKLEYKINTNKKCDIFFAISYFGYNKTNMDKYIEQFKKNNVIVIEDITHRLFSQRSHSNKADYLIASLRKWGPLISGGIAIKLKEKFNERIFLKKANQEIINLKKEAMIEKAKYINGDLEIKKESFLNKYKEFNEYLINNYANYEIDNFSLKILKNMPVDTMIKRRKENAYIIYNELKDVKEVKFLCEFNKDDCLLFVPIFIENSNKIENLRRQLIDRKIYIPSHWEKSSYILDNTCNIYGREMSLICDQRYSIDTIKKYMKIIKSLIGMNKDPQCK